MDKQQLKIGALLSTENHEWFNKQSPQAQAEMNRIFQEYKKCKVVLVDSLDLGIEIKAIPFEIPDEKQKYNRAKEKREFRKRIDEEYEL